jgi:hypothetical protein
MRTSEIKGARATCLFLVPLVDLKFLVRTFGNACRNFKSAALAKSVLVNLVENAAFGKVFLLRLGPAAKNVIDREQLDFRE